MQAAPARRARSPQDLHDRSTRGESLSPDERAVLDTWYARLDREEEEALLTQAPAGEDAALQAQVNAAVQRLSAATEQIKRLSAENEALRAEIVVLRRRLAEQHVPG